MLAFMSLVLTAIQLYQGLIIAAALMTWIPSLYHSSVGRFLRKVTDPVLNLFDFIPVVYNVRLNAIAAIFFLDLVQRGMVALAIQFRVR